MITGNYLITNNYMVTNNYTITNKYIITNRSNFRLRHVTGLVIGSNVDGLHALTALDSNQTIPAIFLYI